MPGYLRVYLWHKNGSLTSQSSSLQRPLALTLTQDAEEELSLAVSVSLVKLSWNELVFQSISISSGAKNENLINGCPHTDTNIRKFVGTQEICKQWERERLHRKINVWRRTVDVPLRIRLSLIFLYSVYLNLKKLGYNFLVRFNFYIL